MTIEFGRRTIEICGGAYTVELYGNAEEVIARTEDPECVAKGETAAMALKAIRRDLRAQLAPVSPEMCYNSEPNATIDRPQEEVGN